MKLASRSGVAKLSSRALLFMGVCLTALPAAPAFAQSAAPAQTAQIEEVVVTAQRREEAL